MEKEPLNPKNSPDLKTPAVKKTETSEDWIAAMLPTLALAKDYESERRKVLEDPETQWNPEPETHETVRFSDCDPFGHLNNARYFDYFVNARDQHLLEAYQVDSAVHSVKYQESWVVREHRISYLRPAKLKEKVRIRSRLLDYSENETFVESLMLSHEGRHLKAMLWSRYSYVNLKTGRIARHPDFVLKILKATRIEAPAYQTRDFELRIKNVMEELRNNRALHRKLLAQLLSATPREAPRKSLSPAFFVRQTELYRSEYGWLLLRSRSCNLRTFPWKERLVCKVYS